MRYEPRKRMGIFIRPLTPAELPNYLECNASICGPATSWRCSTISMSWRGARPADGGGEIAFSRQLRQHRIEDGGEFIDQRCGLLLADQAPPIGQAVWHLVLGRLPRLVT